MPARISSTARGFAAAPTMIAIAGGRGEGGIAVPLMLLMLGTSLAELRMTSYL